MKRHTRLTPEQTKDLLRRYGETNEPVREIADRFGVDPSYPTLLARRSGLSLRAPNNGRRPKVAREGRA